ncbi:arginase [Gudongella oleilytica]|uniref:arginase n=1 Tax=Gudongella oleilytica TaxID=1582259 RepID=UPI000FF87664|nr:arginase [Gudongella oleilytica]
MKKKVDLIGVQVDCGASKVGASIGPVAIRIAGICEGIRKLGYELEDKGDIIQPKGGASSEKLRNHESVISTCKSLYESTLISLEQEAFPIAIGGDHSLAAGSISATLKHHKGKVGVIWIDAHGDWNDDKITETGNMHGMSFSAVCGHGPDVMVDYGQGPVYADVTKCVQIGGRDIDAEEAKKMKAAGLNVFAIDTIDKLGMQEVMKRAIEIASNGTDGIHLSFDIDSLTPEAAPGTGTKVHSGLTIREAFLAVEMLHESGKLLSMDMVEVNPILDISNKTAKLASELVLSALGKVVY